MSRETNKRWFWHRVGPYCRHCGYDKSIRALHCHHLDNGVKKNASDTLAIKMTLSRKALVDWIIKTRFIIICANCHAELHDGLWQCPRDYPGDNVLFHKYDGSYVRCLDKILCLTPEEDQPSRHIKKIRV